MLESAGMVLLALLIVILLALLIVIPTLCSGDQIIILYMGSVKARRDILTIS